MKKIPFLFLVVLWMGCSRSLVYSPSINLPHQPIQEKEIDFQGSFELLPEARPENIGGSSTTVGLSGQVSYGFSNSFSMTAKGWADTEGRENLFRSGYALSGQFLKQLTPDNRLLILPRAGFALNGSDIEGYGLGTSVVYHQTQNTQWSWYGGLGVLWGFRLLEKEYNHNREEKLPMGFGIIGNAGLSWQFAENIRANLELNPVYQINTFDENTQFLLAPSIGIGYTIKRSG